MNRIIIACFSIFIGTAVITMWVLIAISRQLPEGRIELTFHLTSECIMAGMCILSGISLLRRMKYAEGVNLLALGMVVYSVLNAAGYYGEQGDSLLMFLFSLLFVLTVAAILMHIRIACKSSHELNAKKKQD